MKIVIPGGTGQIGRILTRAFERDNHEVIVLSRSRCESSFDHSRVVPWDAETIGDWAHELNGADVVINLAGRSVNCRYNQANKQAILDSRVNSTHAIGQAISEAARPPRVWLQSSTATIYAHRYDAPNDEETGIIGGEEENLPDTWRFSIDVAKAWEAAADKFECKGTRKVLMRTAMVMSHDRGGVFDTLLTLVRRGLGGTNGNGRQYLSWIHADDFVRSIYWLIDHAELSGPVNIASPNPLPNADFMRQLRLAWGIRFGLPSTKWMLEIGTFLMRTETELVLKSRRVVSGRLIDSGFEFRFPEWAEAARDLWEQSRANRAACTRAT